MNRQETNQPIVDCHARRGERLFWVSFAALGLLAVGLTRLDPQGAWSWALWLEVGFGFVVFGGYVYDRMTCVAEHPKIYGRHFERWDNAVARYLAFALLSVTLLGVNYAVLPLDLSLYWQAVLIYPVLVLAYAGATAIVLTLDALRHWF